MTSVRWCATTFAYYQDVLHMISDAWQPTLWTLTWHPGMSLPWTLSTAHWEELEQYNTINQLSIHLIQPGGAKRCLTYLGAGIGCGLVVNRHFYQCYRHSCPLLQMRQRCHVFCDLRFLSIHWSFFVQLNGNWH